MKSKGIRRFLIIFTLLTFVSFANVDVSLKRGLFVRFGDIAYADSVGSAANMIGNRCNHGQSTLGDGRVLVTGGYDSTAGNSKETNTAWIYNPSANSWSNAANIPEGREGLSQSTLNDGRVLVTGGYSGGACWNTAWIYNPSTNAWSNAAKMPGYRAYHAQSTLSDGRVLVTGGTNGMQVSTAWIYDPSINIWSSTTNLPIKVDSHAQSTLSDGRVLITGGEDVAGRSINATWIYNINSPPKITVSTPTSNQKYSGIAGYNVINLSGTIKDIDNGDVEKIFFRIDGSSGQVGTQICGNITSNGSNQPFSGTIDVNAISEGNHTLYVWVQDNNGGKSTETAISFLVDKSAPVFNISFAYTSNSISISSTASDNITGLAAYPYRYTINNNVSAWLTGTTYIQGSLIPNTQYTVKFEVKDAVGNTASSTQNVYTRAEMPSFVFCPG